MSAGPLTWKNVDTHVNPMAVTQAAALFGKALTDFGTTAKEGVASVGKRFAQEIFDQADPTDTEALLRQSMAAGAEASRWGADPEVFTKAAQAKIAQNHAIAGEARAVADESRKDTDVQSRKAQADAATDLANLAIRRFDKIDVPAAETNRSLTLAQVAETYARTANTEANAGYIRANTAQVNQVIRDKEFATKQEQDFATELSSLGTDVQKSIAKQEATLKRSLTPEERMAVRADTAAKVAKLTNNYRLSPEALNRVLGGNPYIGDMVKDTKAIEDAAVQAFGAQAASDAKLKELYGGGIDPTKHVYGNALSTAVTGVLAPNLLKDDWTKKNANQLKVLNDIVEIAKSKNLYFSANDWNGLLSKIGTDAGERELAMTAQFVNAAPKSGQIVLTSTRTTDGKPPAGADAVPNTLPNFEKLPAGYKPSDIADLARRKEVAQAILNGDKVAEPLLKMALQEFAVTRYPSLFPNRHHNLEATTIAVNNLAKRLPAAGSTMSLEQLFHDNPRAVGLALSAKGGRSLGLQVITPLTDTERNKVATTAWFNRDRATKGTRVTPNMQLTREQLIQLAPYLIKAEVQTTVPTE